MRPDGSAQARLTYSPFDEIHPLWSPTGDRLVFRSDRGGNADIHTVATDGSGESRLTSDSLIQTDPTWSADGGKISYISPDGIHITNADGSNKYWVPKEQQPRDLCNYANRVRQAGSEPELGR